MTLNRIGASAMLACVLLIAAVAGFWWVKTAYYVGNMESIQGAVPEAISQYFERHKRMPRTFEDIKLFYDALKWPGKELAPNTKLTWTINFETEIVETTCVRNGHAVRGHSDFYVRSEGATADLWSVMRPAGYLQMTEKNLANALALCAYEQTKTGHPVKSKSQLKDSPLLREVKEFVASKDFEVRTLADHIQVTTPAQRYRYSMKGRDVDPVVLVDDIVSKRQP